LHLFIIGAFYSTWQTNIEGLHMAKYYNVREGNILWINGKSHSQSEIVEPGPLGDNIDCRTMSQNQTPSRHTHALFAMQLMREDEGFDLMD